MELFILRHGEAGKSMPARRGDVDRALTAEGEEESKEVAEAISSLDIKPDLIITSPLKRAHETADIAARALKARVEVWDELTPEGDKKALLARLSKLKRESRVLCVGHEPYLTAVISEIIGNPGGSRIILRKAGLARLTITSFAPKVGGELRWLLTPKLLKQMS